MMRAYWLGFISIFFCSVAVAAENVVNVFNWGNYIPQRVLTQFTKETGITVQYSLYADNEELYTKLKLNPHTYDVIFPSSYLAGQMIKEGLLLRLDRKKLSNASYLNPALLHFAYDPQSEYTLPFTWGSAGIALNTVHYDLNSVSKWQDLWQPRFHDQLLVVDEARTLFDVAMTILGYSINDESAAHIEEAYQQLKKLLPNIKIFNEEQETSIYADDDAAIGIALSQDVYRARFSTPTVYYIYPAGKALLWIDTEAIPSDAPHVDNAYAFLNFILRPDISALIAEMSMLSSPNLAAIKQLPQEMRNNPVLYPSASVLANSEAESNLSEETKMLMESYWERLKLES